MTGHTLAAGALAESPPGDIHMLAGYAAADITPPIGAILNGFIARTSASTGVDTPLAARVLLLENDATRALIVSFDLLGLSPTFADHLVARIGDELGLPPDQVILACTHTHSGPMTLRLRGLGEADAAYLDRLERATLEAARQAREDLQPVRLSWAGAPLALTINRRQECAGPNGVSVMLGRNPSGPAERDIRVLHLHGQNRSILLLHYACHPYCLGGDCTLISADFWGYAAAALAAEGHSCVYLNGGSGNLSPEYAFGGPPAARQTGHQLAEAVLSAIEGPRQSCRDVLVVGSRRFLLPHDAVPPLEQLRNELHAVDKTVREEERTQPLVIQRLRTAWREWICELQVALGSDGGLAPLPARVSIARIGDGSIVALPGEMFFETARDIASCLGSAPVCVAGYCHGYTGYIPTPEAFPLGGYEVEEAHRYTGLWRVSPQAAALIQDQVLNLWSSLHHDVRG